ncbi:MULTISPECIES: lipopolysaccharide biosynthesis protein [Tenacibaculum]|uniref:lipopolysaccharide biosynthesis protein n=1 Tax=Tenacibaculum TaxID=104267 RepID=UPI001F0A3C26|nr:MULTISPECIES: lipopolysaccharide biosynthesis protein [Tenacibaculum]MCH3881562.1 lipopolysaccharide biosynthesis protein [Tenacibaculum aquimarinum]MDO6598843.1 lipopolysaccharide biosynthesis protein [Tenacibaculum sp. 1_MG-2023]
MTLKNHFKKGLVWTFIDNVFLRGFTFIILLGLARLLSPKDFGLIGIISIFIVIGTAIIEGGMGNSIIRDNTSNKTDYTSVFYGNLILSFIIYPILYITAPYIAIYFNEIQLVNLIRVYSISFILSAFFSIQQSVLIKEMKFKKITLFNLPGVILGSFIGLILAYLGYGVWSLVWMHLSTQAINAIIYWINSDWIPEFKICFKKLKKHFLFGYKLMISSLLSLTMKEVYPFIIGKFFSINILGYYSQAKALRGYPVNLISSTISRVTYPLLSKIQNDSKKVSQVYRSILKNLFFTICPIMFYLMIIAKPLFIVLFTEKWLPAVPYFQILVISGMLIPIHSFNINVFKIYNRTDLFLKLAIVKLFMVTISVFLGIKFGIYGLLTTMVMTSFLALLVNTYYSGKLINYNTLSQLKDMSPIFLIGIVSSAFCYFLLIELKELHNILIIIIIGILFGITYLILSYFLNKKSFLEVKYLILSLINKKG